MQKTAISYVLEVFHFLARGFCLSIMTSLVRVCWLNGQVLLVLRLGSFFARSSANAEYFTGLLDLAQP